MTPAQAAELAEAKTNYNAFLAACPSRQLLDRVSNKWVVLVLCALAGDADGERSDADGSPNTAGTAMRYSALSRLLAGVSQKMLTQTLRSLERDGLLARTVTPTVPVTVTYELTYLGWSLHNVVRGLRYWAQANMDEVSSRRRDYDAANGAGTAG